MNGYAGKILRINLTGRKATTIPTSRYEQWVGGHGIGSAIFFDLVKDKSIDGFDPANVITIMTSPLSGTLVPGASGRTEVQGIGVQSIPIGWFTRSNFGGRFSAMLKFAGWDGIVIEGRADEHVWLDIRNDRVKIRNCSTSTRRALAGSCAIARSRSSPFPGSGPADEGVHSSGSSTGVSSRARLPFARASLSERLIATLRIQASNSGSERDGSPRSQTRRKTSWTSSSARPGSLASRRQRP